MEAPSLRVATVHACPAPIGEGDLGSDEGVWVATTRTLPRETRFWDVAVSAVLLVLLQLRYEQRGKKRNTVQQEASFASVVRWAG